VIPRHALLLLLWGLGAAAMSAWYLRVLPKVSASAREELASDDERRRQAYVLIAFTSVMLGALWPIVVPFVMIASRRPRNPES
jgi:hypothetical protein